MQLILDTDEAWSIVSLVVSQIVDGVELSDQGKAAVREWRTGHADGTEAMAALAEELNETLGVTIDEKTRRRLRRKGGYVQSH